MHTVQIMLVEADDAEEAFRIVEDKLSESHTPRWSDWHNASSWEEKDFAGRWSGEIFLTPEQEKMSEEESLDRSTIPNHLCYADDPEMAEKVLDRFLTYRQRSLRDNVPVGLPTMEELIEDYNPRSTTTSLNTDLWKLGRLVELLDNEWTSESAIYDLESWTPSIGYFLQRCSVAPHRQFLIPVDFHH